MFLLPLTAAVSHLWHPQILHDFLFLWIHPCNCPGSSLSSKCPSAQEWPALLHKKPWLKSWPFAGLPSLFIVFLQIRSLHPLHIYTQTTPCTVALVKAAFVSSVYFYMKKLWVSSGVFEQLDYNWGHYVRNSTSGITIYISLKTIQIKVKMKVV